MYCSGSIRPQSRSRRNVRAVAGMALYSALSAGDPAGTAVAVPKVLLFVQRCLLIVAALAVVAAPSQAQIVPESRLKAAIVSKLPQFVEWPEPVLEGRSSFDICVAAPDPFGSDLSALVADETVAQRR